jgi:replicative DNA helicase
MHLPAATAMPILELVPDTAIWRPDNRWAYEVIRHLVEREEDPDPVVVLHTAGRRPPADAAHPGEPISADRLHRFAVHLAEIYTGAVTPAAAPQYAREVLDEAYRRAVGLHGTRMTQLSESGAPRGDIYREVMKVVSLVAEVTRVSQRNIQQLKGM